MSGRFASVGSGSLLSVIKSLSGRFATVGSGSLFSVVQSLSSRFITVVQDSTVVGWVNLVCQTGSL